MKERIKKLRKMLDLTQQEFADRIGVKRNTIANYEVGRNDPVDSIVSLICREFHVSETWLRTGEGEIFVEESGDEFAALAARYPNLTPESLALIRVIAEQPKDVQHAVAVFLQAVAAALREDADREALHAELDRQLDEEKEAAERSAV